MAAVLCVPGCTCGRHRIQACPPDCACNRHKPKKLGPCPDGCTCGLHSPERAQLVREALQGKSRPGMGYNFHGGVTGNVYATILLPTGYKRHHYVKWGPGSRDLYELDFAHEQALVNVELDGPYHSRNNSPDDDAVRDSRLRGLGWKIIRIVHD